MATLLKSSLYRLDESKKFTGSWWTWLATMVEVARQRRQLASLDKTSLADIGMTSTAAHNEASRSFWDLPERFKA